MSRSRVQVDLLNKKSNRYIRGTGAQAQAFNEDFEELRMITNEDCFDGEDDVNINRQEISREVVETEQSEFRKLPQLDSFDSMSDEVIGKEHFRKNSKKEVAQTTNLEQKGCPFEKKIVDSKKSPANKSSNNAVVKDRKLQISAGARTVELDQNILVSARNKNVSKGENALMDSNEFINTIQMQQKIQRQS